MASRRTPWSSARARLESVWLSEPTRGNVVRMVLNGAFRQVALGLAIGIPLALLSGWLISSQLFEVKGHDPLALGLAARVTCVVCRNRRTDSGQAGSLNRPYAGAQDGVGHSSVVRWVRQTESIRLKAPSCLFLLRMLRGKQLRPLSQGDVSCILANLVACLIIKPS